MMLTVSPTFNELVLGHLKEYGMLDNFNSTYTLVAIAKSSTKIDQSLCDPIKAASLLEHGGALSLNLALAKAFEAKNFEGILYIGERCGCWCQDCGSSSLSDAVKAKPSCPSIHIYAPPSSAPPQFHYPKTQAPSPTVARVPVFPKRTDTQQSLPSVIDDKTGCSFRTPFTWMWETVKSCWGSTSICCVRCGACLDNTCCSCDERTLRDLDVDNDIFNLATLAGLAVAAAEAGDG
ncbi:hypothetical protein CALVIDRAFT_540072 [Calocera viscosa TUFC12733]|uniref:Uncharacterized protein n=1 Tax=Calocera viscosa (strain TUFC12733) TaxID=1330018 RepID=A0A167J8L3_CALVF|nr:hypothetical protein CALVIDRAFT_540072 [Calocera viscosa TUFC12733]